MLQHIDQAATSLRRFSIDKADNSVFQIIFVNLPQIIHGVRLSVSQELHEHLPVHGEETVELGGLADDITVVCQPLQKEFLVVFFR